MKSPVSTLAFTVSVAASIFSTLMFAGCNFNEGAVPSSEDIDQDRRLRENMRVVQVAAEHYAADRDGQRYPTSVDTDFKTYFPGGSDGSRATPIGPVNPFSGENEFPTLGSEADIRAIRQGTRVPMELGVIKYTPLENGSSYAIVGGAHDGKALMDQHNPDQILIFTDR